MIGERLDDLRTGMTFAACSMSRENDNALQSAENKLFTQPEEDDGRGRQQAAFGGRGGHLLRVAGHLAGGPE
jgi:hypothetical protein